MAADPVIRIRDANEANARELGRMRFDLPQHMQNRNASLASMSDARKSQRADEYRSKIRAGATRAVVATCGPDETLFGIALGSVSSREDLSPSTSGKLTRPGDVANYTAGERCPVASSTCFRWLR